MKTVIAVLGILMLILAALFALRVLGAIIILVLQNPISFICAIIVAWCLFQKIKPARGTRQA